MKKEFQGLMKTKCKSHTWPSTTQTMEWGQVTATEWFLHYWPRRQHYCDQGGSNAAWLSCLVGSAGEVVACKSTSRILLVLASGKYAFAAWDLEPVPGSAAKHDEHRQFQLVRAFSLHFHWVTDLKNWVAVPVKPMLAAEKGPLVLQQTGPAMDLILRRVEVGLNLTVQQCKDLLRLMGVEFKQNQSRASLHNLLLDVMLQTAEEKNQARIREKKRKAAMPSGPKASAQEEVKSQSKIQGCKSQEVSG